MLSTTGILPILRCSPRTTLDALHSRLASNTIHGGVLGWAETLEVEHEHFYVHVLHVELSCSHALDEALHENRPRN